MDTRLAEGRTHHHRSVWGRELQNDEWMDTGERERKKMHACARTEEGEREREKNKRVKILTDAEQMNKCEGKEERERGENL